MIAALFPGQGAQKPGMLSPWLEIPAVAQTLGSLSEATEIDLITHGTTSSAETIRDTSIAQPLLVAAGLATAHVLLGDQPPGLVAGHSVGEFGAVALAGVISDEDAVRLVTVRGRAMAEAAAQAEPTSMAAVLGGDIDEVEAAITQHGLTAANVNGGGQVVAAGSKAGIGALMLEPPRRARVIELEVAGAFHTHYMASAVAALRTAVDAITATDPVTTLLSNADGTAVTDGAEVTARLVAQVANPVRWDLCQAAMVDAGVSALIEVAPGGVLTSLAKRTMKGTPAVALTSPDDLDAARALLAEHS